MTLEEKLAYLKGLIESNKGGIIAETDPTVYEWAKQPQKPDYTAEEVGALPDTTVIPSVDGFITKNEADSTYQKNGNYALKSEIPDVSSYLTKGTADSTYQAKGNYLTQHQDISGKADKSEIPKNANQINFSEQFNNMDIESGFAYALGVVNEKQDKLTPDIDYISKDSADSWYQKKGNYALKDEIPTNIGDLNDWKAVTDVAISSVTYRVYWKVAPTSSNQVYGWAIHPNSGKLYSIYNNKGTYTATDYSANTNTKLNVYRNNQDVELPILAASAGSSTASWTEPTLNSYKSDYGSVPDDATKRPTINPKTGKVTFNGPVGGDGLSTFIDDATNGKFTTLQQFNTAISELQPRDNMIPYGSDVDAQTIIQMALNGVTCNVVDVDSNEFAIMSRLDMSRYQLVFCNDVHLYTISLIDNSWGKEEREKNAEDYEFINEVTMTANAALTIDRDSDGNTFRLKKAIAIIEYPSGKTYAGRNWGFGNSSTTRFVQAWLAPSSSTSSSMMRSYIKMEEVGGYWEYTYSNPAAGAVTLYTNAEQVLVKSTSTTGYITQFTSNGTIETGIKVRIMGVRA